MSAMRPLIEWLGARWKLGSAVAGAAWDPAGVAGFALADGTLAIVPDRWDGGPEVRYRPEGGVEAVPARQAPPPAMRASAHAGAATCLVRDGAGGFLGGGADGRVVHCGADGAITPVGAAADGVAIGCVAAADRRAYAAGSRVTLLDAAAGSASLDLSAEISALGFDPSGRLLAAAHAGGITLWDGHAPPRLLASAGRAVALSWHPDGTTLAAAMQPNALQVWRVADGATLIQEDCPDAPSSVQFGAGGGFLATSNTGAIIAWRVDARAPNCAPMVCGIASSVPTSAVACHPRRAVIAAGYRNGAIMLCQPGSRDVLFVRAADGDAVGVLAWSADGSALAHGTQAGEIGVIVLPDTLFRAHAHDAAGDVKLREPAA